MDKEDSKVTEPAVYKEDSIVTEPTMDTDSNVTEPAVDTDSNVTEPAMDTNSNVTEPAVDTDSNVTEPAVDTDSNVTELAVDTDSNVTEPAVDTDSNVTEPAVDTESNVTEPAVDTESNVTEPAVDTESNVTEPAVDTHSNVTEPAMDAEDNKVTEPAMDTEDKKVTESAMDTEDSNVIELALHLAKRAIAAAVKIVEEDDEYIIKNVDWLTHGEFTPEKGRRQIEEFVLTWEYQDRWVHYTKLIETRDLVHSFHYIYSVRWSVPTSQTPTAFSSAFAFFTIKFNKNKPPDAPVEVSYFFEGQSLLHRPGMTRFREKWVRDMVEAKHIIMKSFPF
ncbi:A-kinase anchor protein 14 [Molossus nigricans]